MGTFLPQGRALVINFCSHVEETMWYSTLESTVFDKIEAFEDEATVGRTRSSNTRAAGGSLFVLTFVLSHLDSLRRCFPMGRVCLDREASNNRDFVSSTMQGLRLSDGSTRVLSNSQRENFLANNRESVFGCIE